MIITEAGFEGYYTAIVLVELRRHIIYIYERNMKANILTVPKHLCGYKANERLKT